MQEEEKAVKFLNNASPHVGSRIRVQSSDASCEARESTSDFLPSFGGQCGITKRYLRLNRGLVPMQH